MTALRAACNDTAFCASLIASGSCPSTALCRHATSSAIDDELLFFNPSPKNSSTAVGDCPGLPIAAMQRVASQCPPISFTAVLSTAGAVLW